MIKIQLTKLKQGGIWVHYKHGIRFKLQYLSPQKRREFMDACTEEKFVDGQLSKEINWENVRKMTIDYILQGWDGFLLDDETKICPVTLENKLFLMQEIAEFSDFIDSTCISLEKLDAFQKVADEKNLQSLPDGILHLAE